jgi:hypothetical protein
LLDCLLVNRLPNRHETLILGSAIENSPKCCFTIAQLLDLSLEFVRQTINKIQRESI